MDAPNDQTRRNLEDFAGIASDWFWETDSEHRFTYFSNLLEQITKLAPDKIIGVRRDVFGGAQCDDPNWKRHLADLSAHRTFRNFEYAIQRPTDGAKIWIRVSGQPLFAHSGQFIGYRGTGHDVTHEKEAMRRLMETNAALADRNKELDEAKQAIERTAFEDALTGLLNRRAFERDLKTVMQVPDQQIGLLHVDLDRFKRVNDTLGHQAGDTVLISAAKRIATVVAQKGKVYRVGGDEFLVVLNGAPDTAMADWIGDSIVEAIACPIHYGQQRTTVGASVGIAIGNTSQISADRLLMNADVALYEAKRGGRNQVRQITPQIQLRIQAHRQLAANLPAAFDHRELVPYFQPQVHVGTGAVVGAEALVRWLHPELGTLEPGQFLGAAGELGLMAEIDKLMLREALEAADRLTKQGLVLPSVSVNISAARLMDAKLPDDVDRYWVNRNCKLCIELLETIYFDESRENAQFTKNLMTLRDMGVRIETDDFGSGRASITGLLKIRPDRLKIDRSLIQAAVHDPVRRSVVAAILDMTRALGIEALAEGVETQDDIDAIRPLGCNIFQGYALSKPLSEAELATYLATRHQSPVKTQTAGHGGLPKRA